MTELAEYTEPVLKATGNGSGGQVYHKIDPRYGTHPIPTCSSRRAENYHIYERQILDERSYHTPCEKCYPDGEGGLTIDAGEVDA